MISTNKVLYNSLVNNWPLCILLTRRIGFMASALISGLSGPSGALVRDITSVVFRLVYSHNASLHTGL